MRHCLSDPEESAVKSYLRSVDQLCGPARIPPALPAVSSGANDIADGIEPAPAPGTTYDASDPHCLDRQFDPDEDLFRRPYVWWKRLNTDYCERRLAFLSTGPFKLWLLDDSLVNKQFPLESVVDSPLNVKKRGFIVMQEKPVDSVEIDEKKLPLAASFGINDGSQSEKSVKIA